MNDPGSQMMLNASGNPQAENRPHDEFVEGLGQSMRALELVIRELSKSEVPVLLLAEGGAGKEATARHIHQLSSHGSDPFRIEPCSSLTLERLTEIESGSVRGTIYFEELADLSRPCQEAFLRVISSLEQASEQGFVEARLICGSAQDLEAEVRSGKLREDVYYRISGVCLRIPPLRQHKDDIPQLISHFLAKYSHAFGRPVPILSPATERLFREYNWPGNIRELEDAVRAIVAIGDESVAMGGLRQRWTRSSSSEGERVSLKQAARAASREAEKELILRVLDRTRWNRKRAAQELQISYKALLYKLKQIGGQAVRATE
jgi:two-component system, NtrC family, response regulator AtoC